MVSLPQVGLSRRGCQTAATKGRSLSPVDDGTRGQPQLGTAPNRNAAVGSLWERSGKRSEGARAQAKRVFFVTGQVISPPRWR